MLSRDLQRFGFMALLLLGLFGFDVVEYRTVRSTTPRSSLFKARYHMPCLKADRLASNSFFTDKALPLGALLFGFGELFWASEVLQALA